MIRFSGLFAVIESSRVTNRFMRGEIDLRFPSESTSSEFGFLSREYGSSRIAGNPESAPQ